MIKFSTFCDESQRVNQKKAMTKTTNKSSSLERRHFLNKLTFVVGSSAALAIAAPLVQATPIKAPKADEDVKPVTKGYQRTEHVDTYYQLADF